MISEKNAAFTNAWCKKKLHRLHRLHAKYLEIIAEKPANKNAWRNLLRQLKSYCDSYLANRNLFRRPAMHCTGWLCVFYCRRMFSKKLFYFCCWRHVQFKREKCTPIHVAMYVSPTKTRSARKIDQK